MTDSLNDLPVINAPMNAAEYARVLPYLGNSENAGTVHRLKFYLIVGALFAAFTLPLLDLLLGKIINLYTLWAIKIVAFLLILFLLARVKVL